MQINNISQIPPIQIKNAEAVSTLRQGSTVHAKVIDVTGNTVTIKLANNVTATASNITPNPLNVGDEVELLVNSTKGGSAQLKMTSINSQSLAPTASSREFMMLSLGIEPNAINARLVSILAQRNIPVTQQLVANLASMLVKNQNLTLDLAVLLAANPEIAKNLDIASLSPQAFSQLSSELNSVLAEISSSVSQTLPLQNNVFELDLNPANFPTSFKLPEGLSDKQLTLIANDTAGIFSSPELSANIRPALASVLNDNPQIMQKLSLPVDTKIDSQLILNIINSNTVSAEEKILVLNTVLKNIPPNEAQNILTSALTSDSVVTSSSSNTAPPALLPAVANLLNIPEAQLNFDSNMPEAVNVKINSLINSMFPGIDNLNLSDSAQALKNAAVTLPAKLNILGQMLNPQNDYAKQLQTGLNQLVNQLQTLNDVNNFYYAQIPFMFRDERNSAELYVLKRNRGNKNEPINPENAKIVLCLETENMGTVESIIHIENKNINLNLRVESLKIKEFLESNAAYLSELINQTGYRLANISFSPIDERITPVNAERVVEHPVYRGTLDLEI